METHCSASKAGNVFLQCVKVLDSSSLKTGQIPKNIIVYHQHARTMQERVGRRGEGKGIPCRRGTNAGCIEAGTKRERGCYWSDAFKKTAFFPREQGRAPIY